MNNHSLYLFVSLPAHFVFIKNKNMAKFKWVAMKDRFYRLFKNIDFENVEDLIDKSAFINMCIRMRAEQKGLNREFINSELERKALKFYNLYKMEDRINRG